MIIFILMMMMITPAGLVHHYDTCYDDSHDGNFCRRIRMLVMMIVLMMVLMMTGKKCIRRNGAKDSSHDVEVETISNDSNSYEMVANSITINANSQHQNIALPQHQTRYHRYHHNKGRTQ